VRNQHRTETAAAWNESRGDPARFEAFERGADARVAERFTQQSHVDRFMSERFAKELGTW
jgi:hypothetical protein